MMEDCKQLIVIVKTLSDKDVLFYANQIIGCLYLNLEIFDKAKKVFDLMKDVAEETRNWCQAIQTYNWIGRTLQQSQDYINATKAFKKMMQLSWITNIAEFEIKSFASLSKQYFYMQNLEKCKFYETRALRGMLENPNSCQRVIAEQLFQNRLRMLNNKMNRFERQGFTVRRIEENKFIDCTDNYEKALTIINDQGVGALHRRDSFDSTKMLTKDDSRRIGGNLVRISTPIEKAMISSPSNNKADMMLLPGYSLQDQENDRKTMMDGMSRAAQNVQEKQVARAAQNATSGAAKKIKNMLSRMNKPKEKKIDYLTPLRDERLHWESLRGDYTVDFNKAWQKAKVKSSITTEQSIYLTHLRDDGQLRLKLQVDDEKKATSTERVNQGQKKKKMKTKGQENGKEAVNKEVEIIKRMRIQQKLFTKTEIVAKELMNLCFNMYEYLQKMEECIYVCEGKKPGSFNTHTVFRIQVNQDYKQIHELLVPHDSATIGVVGAPTTTKAATEL